MFVKKEEKKTSGHCFGNVPVEVISGYFVWLCFFFRRERVKVLFDDHCD